MVMVNDLPLSVTKMVKHMNRKSTQEIKIKKHHIYIYIYNDSGYIRYAKMNKSISRIHKTN